MSYLKNSVGVMEKNDTNDIKVIKNLLVRANIKQKFLNQDTRFKLARTKDVGNTHLCQAIYQFKAWVNRQSTYFPTWLKVQDPEATIYPNSSYYKILMACMFCDVCGIPPSEKMFETDPRIKQALSGRISFETFLRVVDNSGCQTLTEEGRKAQDLLSDPRVLAFLDMLAFAENHGNRPLDYNDAFDKNILDDLSKYPNKVWNGSSAAGRYQFVRDTWNEIQPKLGLFDFTPESQDIAATYRLKTRPFKNENILDALLADDFDKAIQRASYEWASLPHDFKDGKSDSDTQPTSFHSFNGKRQKALSRSVLRQVYDAALANWRK